MSSTSGSGMIRPANNAGQKRAKSPAVEYAPPSPEPRTGRCRWFDRQPPSVGMYPMASDPDSWSDRGNDVAIMSAGVRTRSATRSWKLAPPTNSAIRARTTNPLLQYWKRSPASNFVG